MNIFTTDHLLCLWFSFHISLEYFEQSQYGVCCVGGSEGTLFRYLTPYILVYMYRRFGVTVCLSLHFTPWRLGLRVLPKHQFLYNTSPCFTAVCFTLFCYNVPCQFTPFLNLCALIFCLTTFSWLNSIMLISYFWWDSLFLLCLFD